MVTSIPRRKHTPLALVALAAVLVVALLPLGGCGPAEAVEPPANAVQHFQDADYDPAYLTLAKQAEISDICIAGKVVGENPARWNSPDGNEWTPDENITLPMVFTTYYIEPTEVLFGTPAWGIPVIVLAVGGVLPDGSTYAANGVVSPMETGQEVILFGTTKNYHGPYVNTAAYWLSVDNNSVWVKQGDRYVCQGHAEPVVNRSLTLEEFKTRLAAVAPTTSSTASTTTIDYGLMTTSAEWANRSREGQRVAEELGEAILAYIAGQKDLASLQALVDPSALEGLAQMVASLDKPSVVTLVSGTGDSNMVEVTLQCGTTQAFVLAVAVYPERTVIIGIAPTTPLPLPPQGWSDQPSQ